MKNVLLLTCGMSLLCACEGSSGGAPEFFENPMSTVSPNAPSPTQTTSIQKLTYKVGPFSLPAGQKAATMWESPGTIDFQTEEPLWIVSFKPNIESESGEELPDDLLNLAVVANGGEKNPLCAEKEVANPFIASTSVSKNIELPDGSGYPVLPEDKLYAKVILQNPTGQDFKNVFFKFTITAVPMRSAKKFKDVVPLLLNVDPCDHTPISIAPKEFVKKHVSFKVPENGLLTKAYGLLQDYGVEVSLTAKGQPLWSAKAETSLDHKILSLPTFEDPAGIPLKSGDEISLDVVYDNLSEEWQDSAVGAVMAYMTRSDDENETLPAKPAKAMVATDIQKAILH